jgi:hypothetical protein
MKRYYYKTKRSAEVAKGYRKNGYNKVVSVYEMRKNGTFLFVGEEWINTGAWRGEYATACGILHDHKGYKYGEDRYRLMRKDIKLFQLP